MTQTSIACAAPDHNDIFSACELRHISFFQASALVEEVKLGLPL